MANIDFYIKKGTPVRLGVNPKLLYQNSKYVAHAIVVRGMAGDKYLINDPASRFKRPKYIQKKKVVNAWKSNGGIMFVASRK